MDLKCKKTICVYNKNFACLKDSIRIARNCECASFIKDKKIDKEDVTDVSKDMFEAAPEINPYRHNKNVDIKCNAHCLFNDSTQCVANGITVDPIKNQPTCKTFLRR